MRNPYSGLLGSLTVLMFLLIPGTVLAGPDGTERTILVTAHPHNDHMRQAALKLHSDDFEVLENKVPQKVTSVRLANEAPLVIELLIQDDLIDRVNNEIKGLKEFIRQLPEGSVVLTGYLTAGSLRVTQDFTADRAQAAQSLRILRSSADAGPYNPYVELLEGLRKFDTQPQGRHVVLMVSDGLDSSRGLSAATVLHSIDLERAIGEAQRRGVTVFCFYAPAIGITSNSRLEASYGQGSMIKLANETGGEAFFSGFDFVSFDPYIKEFKDALAMQWLIGYRSETPGSAYREVEVKVEADLHLHYMPGYTPRNKAYH